MDSVSSSVGNAVYSQLQVQQARQAADRAEITARTLQARAGEAQDKADREQENARQLQVQSNEARQNAGAARQNVQSLQSVRELQSGFSRIRDQIATLQESPPASPTPVVNSDGQTTGTLVNTTA